MEKLLLVSVPLIPLLLVLLTAMNKLRLIMYFAPLTALAAALTLPDETYIHLPWILLGTHLLLDEIARLFLLFSAVIWLAATMYVVDGRGKQQFTAIYCVLFLLAMAGNMLLILAADMLSFYLGFALMGLSAYGLILKPSQHARRAARVYLGFTLVGELVLFVAILLIVQTTGSLIFSDLSEQALPTVAVVLLLLGFGIKLALPGLHIWLPFAYTASPIVTAAVLSGPMMNAGLLGWIRFIPAGDTNLFVWGELLIWLGLGGLLLGSALALLQRDPRAVLAYSSIAKMGVLSAAFGYTLSNPDQADLLIAAIVLFAMHHLLVKSALFLGVGEYQKNFSSVPVYIGLVLLSLSLAGLPFSGGSDAKSALNMASNGEIGWLLKLSGFLTALMMLHFLWVIKSHTPVINVEHDKRDCSRSPLIVWFLLLPLAWWGIAMPGSYQFDVNGLFVFLVALIIFMIIRHLIIRPSKLPDYLQPGDVYHLAKRIRVVRPVYINTILKSDDVRVLPKLIYRDGEESTQNKTLIMPGLFWFIVLALLAASLIFPEL